MDNQISNLKDHEKAQNPRRQSGMDRVVEKTTWQKVKKPVTWGALAFVAVILFLVFLVKIRMERAFVWNELPRLNTCSSFSSREQRRQVVQSSRVAYEMRMNCWWTGEWRSLG